MWRNCNRFLFHSFYITNRKGKTCKWFFPFIANKREKLEICVFPSIANKADKVFSFQLKTYFLKALHFGNFKNSVLKWVINTEWIGSQEFQNRNYDKALYDFRQERLSENLTQNVIRRNR